MDVGELTNDELSVQLRTWSARVAADTAVLLRLLGEFDAREAWGASGALSCAHWASWQLGLSAGAAREKVRVARALRSLPLLEGELAAGRVSYAQARAITRVASPAEEQRWIELARYSTAAQLEKAARGVRQARGDKPEREQPAARVCWDDDGTLVLTVRIPAGHAPGVLAALESAKTAEQQVRDERLAALGAELAGRLPLGVSAEAPPASTGLASGQDVSAETPARPDEDAAPPYAEPYTFREPPYPVLSGQGGSWVRRTEGDQALLEAYWAEHARRRAKEAAATAWAEHVTRHAAEQGHPTGRATLADGLVRALTRPIGLPPVTVKVLLDPLSAWGRTSTGQLLPPQTLRQVLTTLPGRDNPRLHPQPWTRHDQGRRSRTVTPAQRELLGQVDGERCRFPSCDRTRHLHAHHVRFWRHGGPTDLSNLVLVCTRHHTLIHTEGYQLVLSPDRTLTVRDRHDIPVPHHPERPAGKACTDAVPPYSSGWRGDPFDLGYIVMVMAQQTG